MTTPRRKKATEAEVTAAIRRYVSDDAYRKRVNRARSFPPQRPGERKRPEYRGPPVEGADLIPLNPQYGMLSDAEFQRLLHGPRDPVTQRQWEEELGGRSIVEYVKDLRTQLEAERLRKARRRHSRTTRQRIIVANKPSARLMSDTEYRLLLRRIDSADFQLKLKRAMHGLSAVEFVKEIRRDLANEDERRHPRGTHRD